MTVGPKRFDDGDIIDVLYETPNDPNMTAMTATEIADEMNENRRTVLRRLNVLHDDDKVKRKEVGSRTIIWWLKGNLRQIRSQQ